MPLNRIKPETFYWEKGIVNQIRRSQRDRLKIFWWSIIVNHFANRFRLTCRINISRQFDKEINSIKKWIDHLCSETTASTKFFKKWQLFSFPLCSYGSSCQVSLNLLKIFWNPWYWNHYLQAVSLTVKNVH